MQEEQPLRSHLDRRLGPGRQLLPRPRGAETARTPCRPATAIVPSADPPIHNHDPPPGGHGGPGNRLKRTVERNGAVKSGYDDADDGQRELRK